MYDELDKNDVLNREELVFKDGDKPSSARTEGTWGENFFWHGDKCYVPVIYKGQKRKKRIFYAYISDE